MNISLLCENTPPNPQHGICGFVDEDLKEMSVGAGHQNGLVMGSHLAFSHFLSKSREQVGKPNLFTQRPSLYCAANPNTGPGTFGET